MIHPVNRTRWIVGGGISVVASWPAALAPERGFYAATLLEQSRLAFWFRIGRKRHAAPARPKPVVAANALRGRKVAIYRELRRKAPVDFGLKAPR